MAIHILINRNHQLFQHPDVNAFHAFTDKIVPMRIQSSVPFACRRRRINWDGPTKTWIRATAGVAR